MSPMVIDTAEGRRAFEQAKGLLEYVEHSPDDDDAKVQVRFGDLKALTDLLDLRTSEEVYGAPPAGITGWYAKHGGLRTAVKDIRCLVREIQRLQAGGSHRGQAPQ